jgi:hypothetical protein
MLVALMMEGKFSGEGLQSLDTDEDLMSAMARELVEKAGVGESADAIWRELDHERERVLPHAVADDGTEEEMSPVLPSAPVPMPATLGIHLVEPAPGAKRRKKSSIWPTAAERDSQLSLFG